MSLTSSLYTGLSGLNVNQTRLNVVGNNIANVNTVGFKASRALFKPQFYVTDSAGSPPTDGFGGTNPSQRGLGAQVSAIEKDWTNGTIEPTGRATDLAIDGNGFFIVQGRSQMFTRDGSFTLNSANQLVTRSGELVQGFGVDANFNIQPGQLQNITIPLGAQTIAQATQNVRLVGNLDASGDIASGASIFDTQTLELSGTSGYAGPVGGAPLVDLVDSTTGLPVFSVGDTLTLSPVRGGRELPKAELEVTATTTVDELMAFMEQSIGIDPSFAPATAPTPGVTATGTLAGFTIGVTGNAGTENALTFDSVTLINQSGTSPLAWAENPNSSPTGESIYTTFVAYDSLGTPVNVSLTAVLESKTDTGTNWRFIAHSPDDTNGLLLSNGTLSFDNSGRLVDATGVDITIDRNATGAGTPISMRLNFEGMTSLTSRSSDMVMTEQDGAPIGVLDSFSIGADGTITGSFTNGRTRTLGQIALATFNNPQGLVDQGGNMFIEGSNSGAATISSPLQLSAGAIRAGALELSNVDLSEQFINMIISTTGFSAASRVISTSDRLIQELLNSSR